MITLDEEVKSVLWPALITILIFGLFVVFVWPNTDTYKEAKAQQRIQAEEIIRHWPFYNGYLTPAQVEEMKDKYDLR